MRTPSERRLLPIIYIGETAIYEGHPQWEGHLAPMWERYPSVIGFRCVIIKRVDVL